MSPGKTPAHSASEKYEKQQKPVAQNTQQPLEEYLPLVKIYRWALGHRSA